MRRLYLQIYLVIVGILGLFGALVLGAWLVAPPSTQDEQIFDGVATLVAELLPPERSPQELEAALARLGRSFHLRLTLWSADGKVLARQGELLPFPGPRQRGSGWMRAPGGPVGILHLPDGRWLILRHPHGVPHHPLGVLLGVGLLALAVGVGAYPLARRLTRRLERLRAGVEDLGGGDLRARVPVEGRDEVAGLALSFNRAADRIEALLGAQRTLLASASHELRSPLARIRVAVELMSADRPELALKVERDIAELDDLIGELLLASRLQAAPALDIDEEVDLLGLVAEEAARLETEAEVEGQAVTVRGDPRLLRRLVRNLLDNARRHGAGSRVSALVGREGGRALMRVCDRGPGVPAGERERIFDPFYRLPGAGPDGAGLGLALVRQIARRHGGEARCQPRDGGGSCFEVELPAEREG
jgi:signal transduction histidine kinase